MLLTIKFAFCIFALPTTETEMLTSTEIRYVLKLIGENTEGQGYANEDEVLEDGTPIGSLQAKLSIYLQVANERESA